LFEKSQIPSAKSQTNPKSQIPNPKLKKILHKTIKKVSEDIENMKFNTAISAMMEFCNAWQENPKGLRKKDLKDFLKILSPFAPHLTEELWQKLGNKKSIFLKKWPKYDPKLIEEEKITLVIQINGKVRDKIEVEKGIPESKAKELALSHPKIQKWLLNKKIKKTIFIKDKLINFVI
ncbi:MAG TPA: leucine--tRNA ligase, partial [Candidatus Atribacteria bacterium]|nr:leucine--tRNA ligase [Candidatus Atribacteria bacterium]